MIRTETYIDVLMAENNIKTDKQMAKLLGLSPQTLFSRLNNTISIKTLEMFSKHFNKPIKEIIR